MFFIYGRKTIRIKRYNDPLVKCEQCGHDEQVFSVYQEYFHLFYIPFFPSSTKTVRCVCPKCEDRFNEKKKNHYLSITRTPLYLYTGVILIAAFVIFLVINNIRTQKQKAEYVDNPAVGDVYLIRQEEKASRNYYYLKIFDIKEDTIELYHSALQYNRFVIKMDDSDYFVKDDTIRILKTDLKTLLEEGTINSVNRNYDKESQFRIEK